MLLVALGYDSDIEGYTGNAWDMNVNVRATQVGLYKDLEGLDVSSRCHGRWSDIFLGWQSAHFIQLG